MKTITMSFDTAEWSRQYIDVEVDDTLSPEEQRDQIIEKIDNGDVAYGCCDVLSSVEGVDTQYNWPEGLGFKP